MPHKQAVRSSELRVTVAGKTQTFSPADLAALPHETVTVRVDGVERGEAAADATGRFVLPLQPLTAGAHQFDVMGATQEVQFSATIDAPAARAQAPFAAARQGQGWRIDWRTPGGGEQTTLILGPAGASA